MKTDDQAQFDGLLPAEPFSRRSFIATAVGAGFALATQPISAQTVIKTDAEGLLAGEIKVPAADRELPGYRAMPAGGSNLPTVLVIHEIFGVHEYLRDVCRRLAKAGYLAVAVDMYIRHGETAKMTNVQEILAGPVAAASDTEHMADLDACAAWAAKNGGDPKRLAVTGFCRGGRTVWLYAAHNPQLKAAVAWYGHLEMAPTARQPKHPIDLAGQLKAPVLGLYAGKDQGITPDQVEDMRGELAKAGSKSQIHVYPDAPHAFHADYRPTYRKDAAEDGWKRLLEWLRQNGV
ncbi:MAG: carboxymethylenebutenolidase [Rhodocyclales bacterium RIFCSPLOWO2_02_FULL_63_24]|nr:MAG: carboxymethylenebutenolidase [Rhodocyclales bacterium GWA2_65_19]OHC68125.1 MAG: carboxymethylenebutenolidase [Rhodocyclales bacterium RIFCSPLOWO2_02_FULL_63_24]